MGVTLLPESSNAETWHYPLQAPNARSASPWVPCRTLLKFALVCDCGEWWGSAYCFAFLSLSHLVCSLPQWRAEGVSRVFLDPSEWEPERRHHCSFPGVKEKIILCRRSKEQDLADGLSLFLSDITAASQDKEDTWMLISSFFLSPSTS